MSIQRYSLMLLLLIATAGAAHAQNDPLEGQDKLLLENERIEDVIDSDKPYLKIPFQEIPEPDLSQIKYESQDLYVETDFEPAPPSPRLLPPENPSPDYNNYIKAGLGRYVTPLLQAYLNTGQQENYDLGLDFTHLSAHNDQLTYRKFRQDYGTIRGSYLTDAHRINGRLHIYNTQYFNYADTLMRPSVEALEDSIRMAFTQFSFGGNVVRNFDEDLPYDYDLGIDFQLHLDRRDNREMHVVLTPIGSYQLAEGLKVSLTSQFQTSTGKIGGETQNRLFLDFTPVLQYEAGNFHALGGVRFNVYNNSADSSGTGAIVPQLELRYKILPEALHIFGGITGGMTYNRYFDLIRVNPYLSSMVQITPSTEKLQIYGGVSGQLSQRADYNAQVKYRRVENALIHLVDFDGAYFTLGYDSLMTVLGLAAEINYDILSSLRLGARVEFNNYSTSTYARNFHAAPLTLQLSGAYTWKEKLTATATLNAYGTTPMTLDADGEVIDRAAFVDLNLGADYQLIDRLSVWLEVNNLLGINYQRWYNYLERPVDFKAGVTVRF